MSATPPPDLTAAPTPAPQRGDRATFATRVDAFVTWLIVAVTQFGALAANVYANAVDAFTSATAAASSASAAAVAAEAASYTANAALWVSGTSYAKGAHAISAINVQTYARKVAGAGTLDPSADPTNWEIKSGYTSFTPLPVAAFDIDCSLGNYFYRTVNGSGTFTFSKVPPAGFSFTIEVQLDAGSIVLPTSVKAPGDLMPTLATGKTHLLMFVTRNGGARWRMTVADSYPN